MSEADKALAAALKAYQRVRKAEDQLDAARADLYGSIRSAQTAGVSLSEMARTFGVSRQAVQRLARR